MEFSSDDGNRVKIPYSTTYYASSAIHQCKATRNEVVYPGEYLSVQLPLHIRNFGYVNVVNVNQKKDSWIQPKMVQVQKDGCARIHDEADNVIKLSKHEHYATLTPCAQVHLTDIQDNTYVKIIC